MPWRGHLNIDQTFECPLDQNLQPAEVMASFKSEAYLDHQKLEGEHSVTHPRRNFKTL